MYKALRSVSYLIVTIVLLGSSHISAQENHSVARMWNEALLESIRNDFARPTVHARNLFHVSSAMYDSWAVYNREADLFFLGNTFRDFEFPYEATDRLGGLNVDRKVEETLSYACYRILHHRFRNSPGYDESSAIYDNLFSELGYDPEFLDTDYQSGSAAALGNYLAELVIAFGLQDESNEQNDYANLFYEPANDILAPEGFGNPLIEDPNRWQPLALDVFQDQSGNIIPITTPQFLSPEWGKVVPFALSEDELNILTRDGSEFWCYHDPGPPPYLDTLDGGAMSEEYKWGFLMVALWGSHLDAEDQTMLDISPGVFGNITNYPNQIRDYRSFYNPLFGGVNSVGHSRNPNTGLPYETNMVRRGDFARVLAEFWADGPDSETPPGHWFTLLNYVNDNPFLVKKYRGEGDELTDLEWDIKSYFTLGGAMHDAAVTTWGLKGYYDYVRPISAIRYMAGKGQSSDPNLPSYSTNGLPLLPGWVELVDEDDPLRGFNNINVGKVKLWTWRGPENINFDTNVAGVGWILGEEWYPYQRPTFVTPPFAGYVSGHSTFSRAAAEVLTSFTGNPYFPGGLGVYETKALDYLVFETGPSQDVTLQWATYRDAADQSGLSRIWGGIHPPADDIPGRRIGEVIGLTAFDRAEKYFNGRITSNEEIEYVDKSESVTLYPNPITKDVDFVNIDIQLEKGSKATIEVIDEMGRLFYKELQLMQSGLNTVSVNISIVPAGSYFVVMRGDDWQSVNNIAISE